MELAGGGRCHNTAGSAGAPSECAKEMEKLGELRGDPLLGARKSVYSDA